jgi:hypothetical protein
MAGGAIAGAGAAWAEIEQSKVNNEFRNWMLLADTQLEELTSLIDDLRSKPTIAAMTLLLAEIFGCVPDHNESIPVILNPITVEDLQPFCRNNWISLQSTGAICSMGAGNRVGNHTEELKRPYGFGNGFILTVRACEEVLD